jgi:hypothetical protein
MPNPTAPGGVTPWIITTPARQSVEEERTLIRSHVMRGKNRKKPPPRPVSWIPGNRANEATPMNPEYNLSIPVNVGGEFSFSVSSAEVGPDMLKTMWIRERKPCDLVQ